LKSREKGLFQVSGSKDRSRFQVSGRNKNVKAPIFPDTARAVIEAFLFPVTPHSIAVIPAKAGVTGKEEQGDLHAVQQHRNLYDFCL